MVQNDRDVRRIMGISQEAESYKIQNPAEWEEVMNIIENNKNNYCSSWGYSLNLIKGMVNKDYV